MTQTSPRAVATAFNFGDFTPEIMEDGYVELNGIWRFLGQTENRRPNRLLSGATLRSYISELQQSCDDPVYRTKGHGRSQKLFAHPVLALEVTRRLSDAFSIHLNTQHLQRHAAAQAAMGQIAAEIRATLHPITVRCFAHRRLDEVMTELREHVQTMLGGKSQDIIHVTGQRYLGLYLMSARELARRRGISSQKIVEHMGGAELGFHLTAAAMAESRGRHAVDVAEFGEHTLDAAARLRELLLDSDIIPENCPVEPPIKEVTKVAGQLKRRLGVIDPDTPQ